MIIRLIKQKNNARIINYIKPFNILKVNYNFSIKHFKNSFKYRVIIYSIIQKMVNWLQLSFLNDF